MTSDPGLFPTHSSPITGIPAWTSPPAVKYNVTFHPFFQRLDVNLSLEMDNSSGTGNSSVEIPSFGRPLLESILLTVVLAAIVILTITGNVLVIASVILNGNLRTTTNYFIANLAVADLLLGTTVLPFSATLEILQYWVFGQIFCDIWAAFDVLCCTASILSLCVISIDRYIGVTRPLQHARIMRHARAAYIIIFVWLLSLTISVAPLIGWKEAPDPDPSVCTVTTHPGYVLFSVSGSFYIPCLIILVVYFRIYRETVKYTRCLKSGAKTAKVDEENIISLRIHTGRTSCQNAVSHSYHGKNSLRNGGSGGSGGGGGGGSDSRESSTKDTRGSSRRCSRLFRHEEKNDKKRNSRLTFSSKVAKFKREKKAAKTLGIVVGVFITCWLPFFIVLPLDSLCSSCYVPPLMFNLFFWLGYCNSTMNPIIYTCFSKEFRRAFLAILRCRRCRRRPKVSLTEMQLRRTTHLHGRHSQKSYSAIKHSLKTSYSNGKPAMHGGEGHDEISTQCHSSDINNSFDNGASSSFGSECKYHCNSCMELSHPSLNQCLRKADNDFLNDNYIQTHVYKNFKSHSHDSMTSNKANKWDTTTFNGPQGGKHSSSDEISMASLSCVSSSPDMTMMNTTLSKQDHDDRLASSVVKGGLMEVISATDRTVPDIGSLKAAGSDVLSSYSLTETISCSD